MSQRGRASKSNRSWLFIYNPVGASALFGGSWINHPLWHANSLLQYMKICLKVLLLLSHGLLCQNSLRWAHSFGQGVAEGVAIDLNSNSVFVGSFSGTKDFDASSSNYTLNSQDQDAFILKSDRDGTFVSAVNVGGGGNERGQCVAVDKLGNIFVGGKFSGLSDFDPGFANVALTSNNTTNLFVAKYGIDGSFKWATQATGTGYSECTEVTLDNDGNIYLTGEFSGLVLS